MAYPICGFETLFAHRLASQQKEPAKGKKLVEFPRRGCEDGLQRMAQRPFELRSFARAPYKTCLTRINENQNGDVREALEGCYKLQPRKLSGATL